MSSSSLRRRENPYMPADHVAENEPLAARPNHRSLTIKESPHVLLTCSTGFPHKIKLRKRVNVWPFNFIARLDYSRAHIDKVQDAVLGGGLHLDIAHRAVEYTSSTQPTCGYCRKDITVGPISNLVLNGRCQYLGMSGGQPQLQPSFSVHMEMGHGAATWSGDGISFKQEIPVTRRVGFEVCGTAKFPPPSVSYSSEHSNQRLSLGEGTYEMRLDQVNPCIWL